MKNYTQLCKVFVCCSLTLGSFKLSAATKENLFTQIARQQQAMFAQIEQMTQNMQLEFNSIDDGSPSVETTLIDNETKKQFVITLPNIKKENIAIKVRPSESNPKRKEVFITATPQKTSDSKNNTTFTSHSFMHSSSSSQNDGISISSENGTTNITILLGDEIDSEKRPSTKFNEKKETLTLTFDLLTKQSDSLTIEDDNGE